MFELQRSFAGGELSPKLLLRNDSATHAASVKEMLNVLPEPYGVASARKGFEFIEEIADETFCRIFEFDVDFDESYAVVFTKTVAYILDRNGFRIENDFIQNGDFTNDGVFWESDNTSFNFTGVAVLDPGITDVQPASIRQEVTVTNAAGTFNLRINNIAELGATDAIVNIGTTEGGAEIHTENITGLRNSITFAPGVLTFWIEVYVPGFAAAPTKIVDSITLGEVVPVTGLRIEFTFDVPYTDRGLEEMQTDMVPGQLSMYLVTREHAPLAIHYDGGVWTMEVIPFTFGDDGAEPPVLNPPLWGTEFPGCITFHNGRLVLGGTYKRPNTMWLSKPLSPQNVFFTDFNLGAQDAASDAMELTLSKHGELQWLQSNTQLFAGLDSGEHIIYATDGVLTPMDAQTDQHSSYGSSRAHAVVVDEQIMYIDTEGRKLRAMQFSDNQKSFISSNVSFQAEHITYPGVFEIEYGTSPVSTMWMPTLFGDLVTCNFDKDQGTIGWAKHTTQGKIVSIALLREFGVDVPWIAVVRNEKLYVERYSANNDWYVDSSKEVELLTPDVRFTGFEHLIGLEVQVLADGKVVRDTVVQQDGAIYLQQPATVVVAGLQYLPKIVTLPSQKDSKQGNTLSFTKQYTELYMYLLDCPLPIINGIDLFKRSQFTAMDTRQTNFNGMIIEGNDFGWDDQALITVEQPGPFSMVISALGGKLKENKV